MVTPTTAQPARTIQSNQICIDTNKNCKSWAEAGDCKSNPAFMLSLCNASCNLCGNGNFTATTSQPTSSTAQMLETCIDTNKNCKSWADNGDCQSNRAYMILSCNASCQLCTKGNLASSTTSTTGATTTTTLPLTTGIYSWWYNRSTSLIWTTSSSTTSSTTTATLSSTLKSVDGSAFAGSSGVASIIMQPPQVPAADLPSTTSVDAYDSRSRPVPVWGGGSVKRYQQLLPKMDSSSLIRFNNLERLPRTCGSTGSCHDVALVADVAVGLPSPQHVPVRIDSRPQLFSDRCLGLWLHEDPLVFHRNNTKQGSGFQAAKSISLRTEFGPGSVTRFYSGDTWSGICVRDSVALAGVMLRDQFLFLARNDSCESCKWAGGLTLSFGAPLDLAMLTRPLTSANSTSYLLLAGEEAVSQLSSADLLGWQFWDPSGRLAGTLSGHYETAPLHVRFEVDTTTTFLLVPNQDIRYIVGLMLPEVLQSLCNWDSNSQLIFCNCTVRDALAPLHISIADIQLLIHGTELLMAAPGSMQQCILHLHATPPDTSNDVFVLGEQLLSKYSLVWDLIQRRIGFFRTPAFRSQMSQAQ
eukprot:gnl/MRDRNA2_/MRDRNA2_75822_c0_seq2.p1 gnl/MRDRNA2_/MRDRNA2_75822_c0~~gnl/MRDRNA2_/MRDRNA2_75822_c0_seq2.p1  ORF type:complete len:670 (-),score=68.94 gnl/MRDRNA2_/MRDRNA2_75822_c0_seq2:131-1879(-)